MERNIIAVQQITQIKVNKAQLRNEKENLRKQKDKEDKAEAKKEKRGRKGKKKVTEPSNKIADKENLAESKVQEDKAKFKDNQMTSIQSFANLDQVGTVDEANPDSSRAKDVKKGKKKKDKNIATQKQKDLENSKALLEKGLYIMSKVSHHPIKQQVNKSQGINLKMRVIENTKFTSRGKNNSLDKFISDPDILLSTGKLQSYSKVEQFYIHCYQYYVTRFGFPMRKIPKNLLPSMEDAFNDVYRTVAEVEDNNNFKDKKNNEEDDDPDKEIQTRNDKRQPQNLEKVFQNLWNLNINPHETKYYPYALVINYLPLPPGVRSFGNSNTSWMFNGEKYDKCYKPGMLYILKNLEFFRSQEVEESTFDTMVEEPSKGSQTKQFNSGLNKMNNGGENSDKANMDEKRKIWREYSHMASNMHFWDGMGREYIVDLEKEYRTWFRNPNVDGKTDVHLTKFYQKDLFRAGKDLERLKKERQQNLREYIHDSWAQTTTDKVSTSKNSPTALNFPNFDFRCDRHALHGNHETA